MNKQKTIFSESGWIAEVIIIEDQSDSEWERYQLEVVRTIQESPIFITPPDEHKFEVSADRRYRAYVDWRLEIENE